MNIHIRRATANDHDLIIEAIIAAEKSNSPILSYSAIFGISEEEVGSLLKEVLDEDVEGQEICASHFLVAEVDGEPAAACASWIEGKNDLSSGQTKASILFHLLGHERWSAAEQKLKAISETNPDRAKGAMQLESVYTRPAFRGKGLTALLIREHARLLKQEFAGLSKAQVILLKNNTSAISAYAKAGFEQVTERTGSSTLLSALLPCPTKILMEMSL